MKSFLAFGFLFIQPNPNLLSFYPIIHLHFKQVGIERALTEVSGCDP